MSDEQDTVNVSSRRHWELALCIGVGLLTLSQGTSATGWFDYAQNISNTPIPVTSTDPSNTTVLSAVTVTCPTAGYIVARADAQFSLGPIPDTLDDRYVGLSITRDKTAPYAAFAGHLRDIHEYNFNLASGLAAASSYEAPGSFERIGACSAGATDTYRFVAWTKPGTQVTATQPRLIVRFLDTKV